MTKSASPKKAPGYQAPAVHKAFEVLRAVASEPNQELGMTELSRKLGYSKSTTHGLVHALLREGALVQEASGRKFFVGPLIVDLGLSAWNYLQVINLAQPVITEIKELVNETVFLGVLVRNRVFIVATAETANSIKISGVPGSSISLFAGAVGKAILSNMVASKVHQLIEENGLPRYTSRSITNENDYFLELKQVRNQGYAIDNEEYLSGVKAVAMAMRNQKGPPMAVWVVGFSQTMQDAKIQHVINVTTKRVSKLREILDASL